MPKEDKKDELSDEVLSERKARLRAIRDFNRAFRINPRQLRSRPGGGGTGGAEGIAAKDGEGTASKGAAGVGTSSRTQAATAVVRWQPSAPTEDNVWEPLIRRRAHNISAVHAVSFARLVRERAAREALERKVREMIPQLEYAQRVLRALTIRSFPEKLAKKFSSTSKFFSDGKGVAEAARLWSLAEPSVAPLARAAVVSRSRVDPKILFPVEPPPHPSSSSSENENAELAARVRARVGNILGAGRAAARTVPRTPHEAYRDPKAAAASKAAFYEEVALEALAEARAEVEERDAKAARVDRLRRALEKLRRTPESSGSGRRSDPADLASAVAEAVREHLTLKEMLVARPQIG